MAMQLIIGALLIVITILIQGVGTTALLRLLFRRFADDGGDFFPEKALPAVILTALGGALPMTAVISHAPALPADPDMGCRLSVPDSGGTYRQP
jgi:hypothetical protein